MAHNANIEYITFSVVPNYISYDPKLFLFIIEGFLTGVMAASELLMSTMSRFFLT